MDNTQSAPSFDTFALVEIMGHLKLAGRVSEQTIAGQGFIRIDVPDVEGQPGYTRLFGPNAIYSITPCSEAIAHAYCERNHTRPVQVYELSLPEPLRSSDRESGLEGDEDDDRPPF